MSDILYLVRHGRTVLNVSGRLRGRVDEPLDGEGEAQAEALGARFTGVTIGHLVTSPLRRAHQTADAIARATATVAALDIDESFSDRDWGPWTGTSEATVRDKFGSVDAAPGVEPADALTSRVTTAALELVNRGPDLPVLIVAHDAVNRAILAHLADNTENDPVAIPQRCGCWNRIERREGRFVATVIDALPDDGTEP